jgi:hypothetical protein
MPGFTRYASGANTPATPARARCTRKPGEMNGLETKYAHHLEAERLAGRVHAWQFERVAFRLADGCTYNPDFLVILADGSVEIHETKGRWEDDALVKIKVAADQSPWFTFRAFQWVKGAWVVREFKPR